jgi:hypothetical protein
MPTAITGVESLKPTATVIRRRCSSGARVEITGALPHDRTRDCHHLGIEIALGAAKLWCPNKTSAAKTFAGLAVTTMLYRGAR